MARLVRCSRRRLARPLASSGQRDVGLEHYAEPVSDEKSPPLAGPAPAVAAPPSKAHPAPPLPRRRLDSPRRSLSRHPLRCSSSSSFACSLSRRPGRKASPAPGKRPPLLPLLLWLGKMVVQEFTVDLNKPLVFQVRFRSLFTVVNTTLAKESIPCVPKKETSTGGSTGKLLYIVMVST
ncbi:hypothetical protein SETIT_7G025800v2 [Setaria italica]|uniref:Uncharacterized protein n=1 Tax=Setaria italica TaxID=4555 RepID=A0A368RRH9_SETIT|nr:hypothetical protein SETIT_7G025800v2 [Setaria italica]